MPCRFHLIALIFIFSLATAAAGPTRQFAITGNGAVADGQTLNTHAIQKTIDTAAAAGGGIVVVPRGVFLSGAIFMKPGVDLQLDAGAVLRGSVDTKNYPMGMTRIEGHFENWLPALVNADACDHLRISGPGMLDGNGQVFYSAFWNARQADPNVTNLAVKRPRLVFIQNSSGVQVSDVRFKDSGFWNLHLYRCTNVLVDNTRFEAPFGKPPQRGPSTDGIDIDSCQTVTVRGCYFAVNDDCVCLKGTKGPFALEDKTSLPVEHIRVIDCTFAAGHGVLTCGSEATVVRDVIVQNCRVTGKIPLVRIKVRPDTPQHYEDIHFRDIALSNKNGVFYDDIFDFEPWTQFFDLKGQSPPGSVVKNITLTNIKGFFGSFGVIRGTPGQTDISDITLQNINLTLRSEKFEIGDVRNLRMDHVTVNGKPFSAKPAN